MKSYGRLPGVLIPVSKSTWLHDVSVFENFHFLSPTHPPQGPQEIYFHFSDRLSSLVIRADETDQWVFNRLSQFAVIINGRLFSWLVINYRPISRISRDILKAWRNFKIISSPIDYLLNIFFPQIIARIDIRHESDFSKPEWLKFLDQWKQKSSLIRSVEHSNIFESFFHWITNRHASVTPAKDVKRWRWNLSPLSFAQITERLSKSYLSILLMSNELILSLKTDFWPILSLSYAILFFKLWKTFS